MQDTGLKRNDIDKFYTIDKIAQLCVEQFKHIIKPKMTDVIIEPSAGSGVFVKHLKKISKHVKAYDISPENDSIIQQNYLTLNITKRNNSKIHVVGNPPFGKQSYLAKLFIKKTCKFADTIAFILPKSFKKNSMKKVFDPFFHLIHQKDIADCSFTINDNLIDIPTTFQIWVKRSYKRQAVKELFPNKFEFVKRKDAHFSMRRIGVNAGDVNKDFSNRNEESHYFIRTCKNTKKSINELYDIFKQLEFKHENTVGPKSISKQEILQKLPKEYVSKRK